MYIKRLLNTWHNCDSYVHLAIAIGFLACMKHFFGCKLMLTIYIQPQPSIAISRAYRPQRGRGHVTRHLAKFKSRLKIVKSTVCIVQSRQQLLL